MTLAQPEFLYFDRSNDQLFFGYPKVQRTNNFSQ